MSEKKSINASTLARVAGNIAAGLMTHPEFGPNDETVMRAVALARFLVAEVERTEPATERQETPK